ncbi:putative NAD dependent epimerase/dehydratase [Phaeobacter inhibens]|uniref:SDR family oxidoreductase n=1 Tax=Phaeobacter inhibens TaxID=221822 RepID=UPI000C9C892E|nr:SDR family oxidoreductase [Phaeobacter inhibens]AUQ57664.1 putative NAD dependent epimerase/dehydratase [Phaeobacter inhibens]AUR10744.1 putative NAD dependent epimerase/dehydratase [Phaeobacter inhibens]
MQVLVAGATGNTGRRVVEKLQRLGHHPIALIREGSDTSILPRGTTTRHGDLTDLPAEACNGCDSVVFAAGSGGDTSAEMTEKVDRDGAKALIDLAKHAGVSKFVMLSTIGADNPKPDSDLAHYLQAKHDADEHLMRSGLDYAILRPVRLTDGDGSGDILFGEEVDPEGIAARGDVAATLADAVSNPSWTDKAARMQSL